MSLLARLGLDARRGAIVLDRHVREGRFQRSLAAVSGVAGLLGGLEVTLQHYRGSYNQRVMYSPVALSGVLFAAGVGGAISPKLARTVLPLASVAMIADGVLGFGFHVRGVARKPGGFKIPMFNLVMGPPMFAPLLLGVGGFLGLVASSLRPETSSRFAYRRLPIFHLGSSRARGAKLQREVAAVTALSALLNGMEATYSHYKTNYRYAAQWVPVALTPPLVIAATAAVFSRRAAKGALPLFSIAALVAGGVGFYFHARGVARRPGGKKHAAYNLIYGPPVLAPLLYAATGFMGLLASRLKR